MRCNFLILLLSLTAFTSCSDTSFDKEYLEKVSGITLPDKYKVAECFDNGEWLTGAVLQVDTQSLALLLKKVPFTPAHTEMDIHLWSEGYIKTRPAFRGDSSLYFIHQSHHKNNLKYIVDTRRQLLWMEISYPDWGGQ